LAYPSETENTVRRHLLQIFQDYARLTVDIIRELNNMIDEMSQKNKKEPTNHNDNIYKLLTESKEIKLKLFEEITSVGTLLVNREGYLRLIFELERMMDNAEASAYRLKYILDGKIKVDKSYLLDLAKLSLLVLNETIKVRDIMRALMFNPEKSLELSKIVEDGEKNIDITHRELDLKILNSTKNIAALLLLRDIAERVEDISDIGVDTVDLLRMLAL
jgi:uncharacterized protein Yka (UPF0111/DUF47 family)